MGKKKKPITVQTAIWSYLNLFSGFDHLVTAVIINHFYGDYWNKEYAPKTDFIDWFLTDPDHGMTFGRKKWMIREILENHHPELWEKHKGVLGSKGLGNLASYRNLLAHSWFIPKDQNESDAFTVTSYRSEHKDKDYKVRITLKKHRTMFNNLTNALKALRDLNSDLGGDGKWQKKETQ